MKRACVAVLALFAGQAWAGVALDFRGIGVPELAEGVIKGVLGRDYVLSAEVAANPGRVTVSVKDIEKSRVLPFVSDVLNREGVAVVDYGGVVYIERKPQPVSGAPGQPVATTSAAGTPSPTEKPRPQEFASYHPKGKSVEFLQAVAKLAGAVVPEQMPRSHVVIYGGDAATVAKVDKLLRDVDTVTPGHHVRAALVEFSESQSTAKSLQAVLSILAGKLGSTYQAGAALANGVTWQGANLQAALTAIEGDNRFRYVAEPSLRVADGEKARLVVGSDVPVRSGVTVDKAGNAIQGVEYRTSGVVIHVEPRAIGDRVSVKVGQQISSFASTTTSNIDSPTLFKRESETTILAKPGELVILAGMDETRDSATRSGFTFLPTWLHGASNDKTRSQLVLMLEVLPDT